MSKRNRHPHPGTSPPQLSRERWAVKYVCRSAVLVAVIIAAAVASPAAFFQWQVYATNCAAIEAQKDYALQMAELQALGQRGRRGTDES